MAESKEDTDRWPFPTVWCSTCRMGFRTVEELIDHQLRQRHWKPIPPPARVVGPAGAAKLKEALEAVEARRQAQKEVR